MIYSSISHLPSAMSLRTVAHRNMSTTKLYCYYRRKTNSYRVENFYRYIANDKISPIPSLKPPCDGLENVSMSWWVLRRCVICLYATWSLETPLAISITGEKHFTSFLYSVWRNTSTFLVPYRDAHWANTTLTCSCRRSQWRLSISWRKKRSSDRELVLRCFP